MPQEATHQNEYDKKRRKGKHHNPNNHKPSLQCFRIGNKVPSSMRITRNHVNDLLLIINQTSSFAFIKTNIPFSTILVINRNSNTDNSTVSSIGIAEIDELFPLYVRTGPSSVVDSVTSSPMLLLQAAAANISMPEKSLPSPISSFVSSEEC